MYYYEMPCVLTTSLQVVPSCITRSIHRVGARLRQGTAGVGDGGAMAVICQDAKTRRVESRRRYRRDQFRICWFRRPTYE